MSQVGLAPETETDEAICLNYLFDSLQLCTTATLFFFSPLFTVSLLNTHTHLFQAALITAAQAVKLSSDD